MKTNTSTKIFVNLIKIAMLFGIGILLVFAYSRLTNSTQQSGVAMPIDAIGDVLHITDTGESIRDLAVQEPLHPGDQLVSSLDSAALVTFFDAGVTLEMYPNTSLVINEIGMKGEQQYAEVQLIQGQVKISTVTGTIGVRTEYGLAAVGGDSSVLAVSANQSSGEYTAYCQAGSCAVQKDAETYTLAGGQLASMQKAGVPAISDYQNAVANESLQNEFASQDLSYPDTHIVNSTGPEPVAVENTAEESVTFQVIESNLQTSNDSVSQTENDPVVAQENDTQEIAAANSAPADSGQVVEDRSHSAPIPNGPWYLISYGKKDNPTSLVTGTKITLNVFPNAGEVHGFTGCNNFSAQLDVNGSYFNVRNIMTTKINCVAPITDQEKTIVSILRKVSSNEVRNGDTLILSTRRGTRLVFSLTNPGGESELNVRPTVEITPTPVATATPQPTTKPSPSTTPAPTSQPTTPPSNSNAFYVSPNGNDNNPGTSQLPWKTIKKAAQTLTTGQTAIVLAGNYPERITISKNGITLQAQGKVQMKGFTISGNYNTVIGFTISDKTENAGVYVKGNYNVVKNNEIFHMNQDGIWFFGSNNVYRGNYIHDILDPSISSDKHADCFQTWAGYGQVNNTLFEGNKCDHNRSSGSNQIFMIEAQSATINNLTIRNNIFIMYDSGYSPLNIDRKDGQYAISNVLVQNNRFENVSGNGSYAIRFVRVTGGEVSGNIVVGYDTVFMNDGSSNISTSGNTLQ